MDLGKCLSYYTQNLLHTIISQKDFSIYLYY